LVQSEGVTNTKAVVARRIN